MVGAPNALQVIPQIMKLKMGTKISNKSAAKSLENLKRRGLITLVKSRSGYYLKLTPTGQIELLAYETKKKVLQTPKRWDKKWRLLIFDIEERHRLQRDQVRHTLIEFDFTVCKTVFGYIPMIVKLSWNFCGQSIMSATKRCLFVPIICPTIFGFDSIFPYHNIILYTFPYCIRSDIIGESMNI